MKKIILAVILSFMLLFVGACKDNTQIKPPKEEIYHSLLLPGEISSNQDDNSKIKDGSLVILTINLPEGKEIKSIKLNQEESLSKVDGNKLAFEIFESTTVFLTLKDKQANPDDPDKVYYKLELSEGLTSDQENGLKILEGSNVIVTISVPEGKEIASLVVNGVESKDIVVNNQLSFIITNNITIALTLKDAVPEYYAVYINIDGFARYYYDQAVSEGKVPNLVRYSNEGASFDNLQTVYPAITRPVQTMIVAAGTSRITGLVGYYFDLAQDKVLLQSDISNIETIYTNAKSNGISGASVRHFIADPQSGGPYTRNDLNNLYVGVPQSDGDKPDATVRINQAIKMVKGEKFMNWSTEQQLTKVPRLLSVYIDDLDGIGHNTLGGTYGYSFAGTEEGRVNNVISSLAVIDTKIGELIQVYKDLGLYDKTGFVITTDHGMTPYGSDSLTESKYTYSKVNDLKAKIESLNPNYKFEYVNTNGTPKPDTTIVAYGDRLQLALTFRNLEYTLEELDQIKAVLQEEEYVDRVLTRNELIREGIWRGSNYHLMVVPSERYHFSGNPTQFYLVQATHDTYLPSSRHIFGTIFGGPIKQQTFTEEVQVISLGLALYDTLGLTPSSTNAERLDIFK